MKEYLAPFRVKFVPIEGNPEPPSKEVPNLVFTVANNNEESSTSDSESDEEKNYKKQI